MNPLTGLFSTSDGQNSMIRVMCFVALINAIAMSWYVLISGVHDTYMVETFLAVAFAGKVTQKIFEKPCGENGNGKSTVVTTTTKDSSMSKTSSKTE